jgi:diaminopimelate decarboxylase
VTLPELLPSLRSSLPPRRDPDIWPATAHEGPHGDIVVGGVPLSTIAEDYGTPTYVLDVADIRQRCREYRAAFAEAELAYAGKAVLCRGVARRVQEDGLGLDVCSSGEIAVAAAAGFPAARMVLHGNAKTPQDLHAALDYHVGRIVIDSVGEIAQLAATVNERQRVLLRVTPGVDGETQRPHPRRVALRMHTSPPTGFGQSSAGRPSTTSSPARSASEAGQPLLRLSSRWGRPSQPAPEWIRSADRATHRGYRIGDVVPAREEAE